MISSIKKIHDIGVFKKYDPRDTGLEKDFGNINFIYGLNTYGKSTLCEIFKDMSDNVTSRLEKRLTIPDGNNQCAIIGLSDGNGVIKLNNNKWDNNKVTNKIMVFDTEFVLKNVFDGAELIEDRNTKENFTDFILGDEGVKLAQDIEELKREQRDEKTKLQNLIPQSQKDEKEVQIKKYVKLSVDEKREDLIEKKKQLETDIAENNKRDSSINKIIDYKLLCEEKELKVTELNEKIKKIRDILNRSFSLSAEAIAKFQKHISEACNGNENAQQWLTQGIEIMGDVHKCPFCGQDVPKGNITETFKEYLSSEYQEYKSEIVDLLSQTTINWDVMELSKDILVLQKELKHVTELFGNEIVLYNEKIDSMYDLADLNEKDFKNQIIEYRKTVEAGINTKIELCNVSIDLEVDTIQKITVRYESVWNSLQQIIKEINTKIISVKDEVKAGMLKSKDESLKTQLSDIYAKIKRLDEENECIAWKNAFEQFEIKTRLIKEKSDELEENQKLYLDQYFEVIDSIFKRYGARKFKIERGTSNNKGFKKVFGINILFNDVLVSNHGKTRSIFSESDKRALALAIFIAKIECMPTSKKKDLILVLDDPITSFDDNRIKSVIKSIMEVASNIEQTFILAHHFMFARTLNETYGATINFYKIDRISSENNGLYNINPDEEFSVGFEKSFNKIEKFNTAESNDLSENELRIFLEEYLKLAFAKQYTDNNLNKKKFGERIDELARIGVITEDVKTKLHHYRTELNSSSHRFQNCTIEDDRNFSIELIQFVFDKVRLA